MDEEQLLRIEKSLDIHDRTTDPYPPAPDGRWPLSVTARALLDEVRRLERENRELRATNARWGQIAAAEGLVGEDAYHAEMRRQEAEEAQPPPAP